MLWEIIAVGTIWFWLPLFIVGIFISEMLDNENSGGATVVAIATVVVIVLFSNFNPVPGLGEVVVLAAENRPAA